MENKLHYLLMFLFHGTALMLRVGIRRERGKNCFLLSFTLMVSIHTQPDELLVSCVVHKNSTSQSVEWAK